MTRDEVNKNIETLSLYLTYPALDHLQALDEADADHRADLERLTTERDHYKAMVRKISEGHDAVRVLTEGLGFVCELRQQLAASQARVQELEQQPGFRTMVDYMLIEQERDRLRTALEQAEADNRKACEIIQAGFLTDTITQADMDWARQALRGAGEEPGA